MTFMADHEPEASFAKRLEVLALTPLLLVATLGIGWIVWCVVEWRHGRTPSYRVLRLHVVRSSDGRPVRLGRSLVRSLICCLLLLPTILICAIVGISFVFGASAPERLLSTVLGGLRGTTSHARRSPLNNRTLQVKVSSAGPQAHRSRQHRRHQANPRYN